MAWTNDWDESEPESGDAANLIHQYIQKDKKATRERANEEHLASSGDNTDTWLHREGSARVYRDIKANLPSASSDEQYRLFHATDTGELLICNGSSWIDLLLMEETTGTVDVVNGNDGVSGSGTAFTNVSAGDVFWVDGESRVYEIGSVTNDTTMTLAVDYEGSTQNGVNFHIGRATIQQFLPAAGGTLYDGVLGSALNANSKKIESLLQGTTSGDAIAYPVDTAELADDAVTAAKLAAGAVTNFEVGHYASDGVGSNVTVSMSFQPKMVLIFGHIGSAGSSISHKCLTGNLEEAVYISDGLWVDDVGYPTPGDIIGPLHALWTNGISSAGSNTEYWNCIKYLCGGGFELIKAHEDYNHPSSVWTYSYAAIA